MVSVLAVAIEEVRQVVSFLSSLCSGGRGRGVWEGVEGCVAEESSLVLSQATTTPLVHNIFEQFFQNQIDGKAT